MTSPKISKNFNQTKDPFYFYLWSNNPQNLLS
jgi:hypothetical protein